MSKPPYSVRDIIYGFITLNEWEWEIINHPVFQRLRRIKQLSLTDMVYPGACHTRFEHSLGVMHFATLMFDSIKDKRINFLKSEGMAFNDAGLERDRVLLRIAALLHDIGHSPFSHTGEELMPLIPKGHKRYVEGETKRYRHEDYSIYIIKNLFKDVIENHSYNSNYHITVDEICSLLGEGTPRRSRSLLWKNIISSQLDADRADYLLRDSKHLGVNYGVYDKDRLLNTLTVTIDDDTGPTLAIEDGGLHVAESLVTARYHMFAQVYFQKTRRIYDYHVGNAMKEVLSITEKYGGVFPPPDSIENIKKYVDYDDWKITGYIKDGLAGEHGDIIINRNHYRCAYETLEVPDARELEFVDEICSKLSPDILFRDEAGNSWYRTGVDDIMILRNPDRTDEELVPLSKLSLVVEALKPSKQQRLYVRPDDQESVRKKIRKLLSK